MKLRKKIRKYISFIVSLVIFIQPLFVQLQLNASQNCYHEQRIQEKKIIEVNQNNNDLPQSSAYCNDSSYYIDITPSNLDGLNLKELFRVVIECAYETNTLHDLPEGLIKCCKSLEDGATSLYMPDLAEALPVVIEKIMDPKMPQVLSRGSRLNALGTHGAFGGTLLDCNLSKVLQLLDELLQTVNQCCNELSFDFDATFTTIAHLVLSVTCDFALVFTENDTNFDGTFSELADIKNTLTICCAQLGVDFSGVFTTLAHLAVTATCDISMIFTANDANFGGTFTVLTDIKNTLTACCAQSEFDFNGTFSMLSELAAAVCDITSTLTMLGISVEGTFTEISDIKNTLTACCAQLGFNFDGTFTALASLSSLLSCNLISTFSALNTNFGGTFTEINDINNTLTTCCAQLEFDFDGTFTSLANLVTTSCDVTSIFTILNANFGGTFTELNDINATLTACCAQLEFDFGGTFTSLANLTIITFCDSAPTFTLLQDISNTLTTCCAQLRSDFNDTFTVLANLVVTASCNLVPIFSALQDIKSSLTACCQNFNATATVLSDIKNTLTLCCAQLEFDFDGTFTALAALTTAPCDIKSIFTALQDLSNTFTTCCTALELNFDGTFTTLANVVIPVTIDFRGVFTTFADIKNTLTACCSAIQNDFGGTFSVISDTKNTVTNFDFSKTLTVLNVLIADICNPTVITQSSFGPGGTMPLIISTPGVYIFGESITFNPGVAARAITIASSNVVLDLQCFTLRQGNATLGVDGVRVNSSLADVTIKNGIITNFSRAGVTVQNNNERIMIENLTCSTCGVRGIELLGAVGNLIQDSKIENCTVDVWLGDYGVIVQEANRLKIVSSDIRNSGTGALAGMRLDTCIEMDLDTITISKNNSSIATFIGMQLLAPIRSSFLNCFISSNSVLTNFSGIDISGASNSFNVFNGCKVINNSAGGSCTGIALRANSTNNMFKNCSVSWNTSGLTFGIALNGSGANNNQNGFINCFVAGNSGTNGCTGFLINGSDSGIILDTTVSDNVAPIAGRGIGIDFEVPSGGNTWVVGNSNTFRNTGVDAANSFGIIVAAGSGNLFTHNVSFRNGGAGALPANQLSGISAGSKVTPTPPATSNMTVLGSYWINANIAA